VLNGIFLFLIVSAVLVGAFTGQMGALTQATIASSRSAVELAIGLIGQMALWLGFMAVLREAGLMSSLSRGLAPVMRRIFPDVPPEHPAMGAMIMNLSANVLGLGNAATPFGLKAMQELDKLNRQRGVATNAMVLFLAINTSGVAVLPLGAVAVRATLGSTDPAGIIVPSLIATGISTIVAISVARWTQRWKMFAPPADVPVEPAPEVVAPTEAQRKAIAEAEAAAADRPPAPLWRKGVVVLVLGALAVALFQNARAAPTDQAGWDTARGILSEWLIPVLMLGIASLGFSRRVKVYEVFVQGAKEGFQIAVMIIPFLVAILVAIGLFRASGAMNFTVQAIAPITGLVGFPAEALPMALIRPLSGSGALAVMTETMNTYGPDSYVGYLVSVINGSTETTFYVLAVYFGAIAVRATRHTLAACLSADATGVIVAAVIVRLFFGF
jgi:spore maturation protein SpmA